MCEIAARCRNDYCLGLCWRRSDLWKFLVKICPNLSERIGEFFSEFWFRTWTRFLEKCRYYKDKLVLSFSDVANKCQIICRTYDEEISSLIYSNRPIPIDVLVEGPALILTELYSEGNDEDVKRLVLLFISVMMQNQPPFSDWVKFWWELSETFGQKPKKTIIIWRFICYLKL